MDELKVHNRQLILWEVTYNKNATEKAKKFFECSQLRCLTAKSETGFWKFRDVVDKQRLT